MNKTTQHSPVLNRTASALRAPAVGYVPLCPKRPKGAEGDK